LAAIRSPAPPHHHCLPSQDHRQPDCTRDCHIAEAARPSPAIRPPKARPFEHTPVRSSAPAADHCPHRQQVLLPTPPSASQHTPHGRHARHQSRRQIPHRTPLTPCWRSTMRSGTDHLPLRTEWSHRSVIVDGARLRRLGKRMVVAGRGLMHGLCVVHRCQYACALGCGVAALPSPARQFQ